MNVPAGTGYVIYVYYRATPADPWNIRGVSPGTVDVTAIFSSDHRDRPGRHHQPRPGRQPAGHLDDQRCGGQRRVRHLGRERQRRLVRRQDRRRRRHRQLREHAGDERPRRHRLRHLRLLPGHAGGSLEHPRRLSGHRRRDRDLQRDHRDRPGRIRRLHPGNEPAGHLDDQRCGGHAASSAPGS